MSLLTKQWIKQRYRRYPVQDFLQSFLFCFACAASNDSTFCSSISLWKKLFCLLSLMDFCLAIPEHLVGPILWGQDIGRLLHREASTTMNNKWRLVSFFYMVPLGFMLDDLMLFQGSMSKLTRGLPCSSCNPQHKATRFSTTGHFLAIEAQLAT